jgi:hypothetical protein
MAGTETLDTGQFLTYLWLLAIPFILHSLLYHVTPSDPIDLKNFERALIREPPWLLRGHIPKVPCKRKRVKKRPVCTSSEGDESDKAKRSFRTYLFPFAMASFRVGCRVERFLRRLGRLRRPSPRYTALASAMGPPDEPLLTFDSDSFQIGVDNHASFCMADSPHLFEDLQLIDQGKQVDGIGAGLVIKGTGTFVMRIEDDDRETHTIKIPNSLYLPSLRVCLLSPQHWAQEAKAMGNKGE